MWVVFLLLLSYQTKTLNNGGQNHDMKKNNIERYTFAEINKVPILSVHCGHSKMTHVHVYGRNDANNIPVTAIVVIFGYDTVIIRIGTAVVVVFILGCHTVVIISVVPDLLLSLFVRSNCVTQ